jgi:hypothetical protein
MSSNISPKYQKNADGYTKWLNHKDVEKRRKAAMMVGELGVAQAIPELIELMENDPDKQVRQNARYSLGMFAAFRDAVESDNEDRQAEAASAVERLVRTAKIGKRANISAARLRPIMMILTVLLVLLLAGNTAVLFLVGDGMDTVTALLGDVSLPGGGGGTSNVENQDIATLVENAQQQITLLEGNLGGLEAKMAPIPNGNQPGDSECPFGYTEAEPLGLSNADRTTFSDIAIVYDTLNQTLTDFDAINELANQTCNLGEDVAVEDAEAALVTLSAFSEQVPDLNNQLAQALIPTETPVPPTATEIPSTATPTPTATPNYNAYAAEIYNIIDEVTGTRGANTILEQYWQEAQGNNGQTGGCRASRPTIPGDYFLPTDLENPPTQLTLAIDNVNLGLQTVREGWDAFQNACSGGDGAVAGAASTGLTVTNAVRASFELADLSLQQLRGAPPPTVVPTSTPLPE